MAEGYNWEAAGEKKKAFYYGEKCLGEMDRYHPKGMLFGGLYLKATKKHSCGGPGILGLGDFDRGSASV